ncbi:hypothetical protein CH373_00190 [Leptospira perolatii]|uniref:Uncharacterized protein n=1 Tax=Leptospira perolatii TaxID=2023191 RepID=A0A2M9ZR23_9LEPT|nr:hypothetical protein [Leptospira perolatii]PJZ70994.1 hypothetical protein CH360_00190 [Leptospira perolatii]PJZ74526.1 hypothetical protein CH373_00190 [Leptospira perolatii]
MENYNSILLDVSDKILSVLSGLSSYRSPYARTIGDPTEILNTLATKAAIQAAASSSVLSFPGGVWGTVALAPEVFLTMRIQGKLVKDIAALYGKEARVTEEMMAYCLFGDRTSFFKNLLRETGTRVLVRPSTWELLGTCIRKIAESMTGSGRSGRNSRKRFFPFLGALVSGGLTFTETRRIAERAKALFSKEILEITEGEVWSQELA